MLYDILFLSSTCFTILFLRVEEAFLYSWSPLGILDYECVSITNNNIHPQFHVASFRNELNKLYLPIILVKEW